MVEHYQSLLHLREDDLLVARSLLRKISKSNCDLEERHNAVCDGFFLGLDYGSTEVLTDAEVEMWETATKEDA